MTRLVAPVAAILAIAPAAHAQQLPEPLTLRRAGGRPGGARAAATVKAKKRRRKR